MRLAWNFFFSETMSPKKGEERKTKKERERGKEIGKEIRREVYCRAADAVLTCCS